MKPSLLVFAFGLAVAAIAVGVLFTDDHYRLHQIAQPSDQAVLDHRDSAYTSMTWVGSASENYLQLRFFDKVEGGLCQRPTWAELNELALQDKRLWHLRFESVAGGAAAAPTWPGAAPDPSTLPDSAYVRFFPAGILLNDEVMGRAGGDRTKADPHILIIGLGSSAGILVLAHHFPNAAITVVDIDHTVIDIVRDHVPLTRWLETQKTADGSPRLRLVAKDARQFVRFDATRLARPYDLLILDAYTAGSTIPSHLMTREFFAQCAQVLTRDGMVLGNIIGSYTGEKHKVLGGCLRSLRAGGLSEAYNIPVISSYYESPSVLNVGNQRNNIVLASRTALDPRRHAPAWQRLAEFVPFPELATGKYLSAQYTLTDGSEQMTQLSGQVPAAVLEDADPGMRLRLSPVKVYDDGPRYAELARTDDPSTISAARRAVAAWYAAERSRLKLTESPLGWSDAPEARGLLRREIDWVKASREVWRVSLLAARDASAHGGEALVGPLEGPERDDDHPTWRISDAPLFTDQMPNADIVNH